MFVEAVLVGIGQVVEVCDPVLKGGALHLAGNLLLLSPPDYLTAGVNLVTDLSLHLLTSSLQCFL